MKEKLRKLKREAMPFLILFLVFDIVIVGAFNYAINNSVKDDINSFFSNFMAGIKFKFFLGIFSDFGGFINLSLWTFVAFIVLFIAWGC